MNQRYHNLIAQEFQNCVDNTIRRITNRDVNYRPFHAALLSEDVLFWSAFERSFSTSFGQRVIEEVAKLVVLSNGADSAERQHITNIRIDQAYEDAIHRHMQDLRMHRGHSSWNQTLNHILATPRSGQIEELRVISDLWWRKDGVDNFISLKTVKPNIDQTAVAKEDCLHLSVAIPNCHTYFGLPYNPFGERREDYAFNPPMGIFDFKRDSVVLIGSEMWDTLGGEGCYNELLQIASEVGANTRRKINELR
mgnify:FL=1